MPSAHEAPLLNLREDIGFFPSAGLIYERPDSPEVEDIYKTDIFNTTLVLKNEPSEYESQLLNYLFTLSRTIDSSINVDSQQFPYINDDHDSGMYRSIVKLQSPEYIELKQNYFIEMLKVSKAQIEERGREVVLAFPIWGAVGILRAMENANIPESKLIPVSISGSVGTETGHAQAGELPDDITNPNNIVLFPDDIYDTCVTLIQLAMERAKKKSEFQNSNVYQNIILKPDKFQEKMRSARKHLLQKDEEKKVWADLVDLLWEVDVIAAPFTIKNPPFAEAIMNKVTHIWVDEKSSEWERKKAGIQGQLMFQTHYINPNYWIIGGKWNDIPLLDTKIRGSHLLSIIDGNMEIYGITQNQIVSLRRSGIDDLSIRAFAGLEGLWVFNPDGVDGESAYSNLAEYYAAHLADFAKQTYSS